MQDLNRRIFLKLSGFSVLPLFTGIPAIVTAQSGKTIKDSINDPEPSDEKDRVWFVFDGPMYKPAQYIEKLQEIDAGKKIMSDFYGEGGSVDDLLKKFAAITGKEAAIYMPSGTMANQLAIHMLSGDNTKVFVQETSHVYRDEADAAQSLFNKRLIPLAKGEAYFTAADLKTAIEYHEENEIFKSGTGGVVSIETPVRRNDGAYIPFEELKAISEYCKNAGYKLHLDGARIFMVTATTGRSVEEYASLFDTVYISLYKCLGAAGGAVLCGSKEFIDKMPHQVKIHGGTMFSNWANASMALYHLEGIDERMQKVRNKSAELIKSLNSINKIRITPPVKTATNIYNLRFLRPVDSKKVIFALREMHNIILENPNSNGVIKFMINDTLLLKENESIVESFRNAIRSSLGK
jgi:threonine aldolase